MSYNVLILKKINADYYLAQTLDKRLSETGRLTLEQTKNITDGFTRLTWYSSCFFDDYQHVCSKLKNEDVRFIKALLKLINNYNIIYEMLDIFIQDLYRDLSDERIRNVTRILAKTSSHVMISNFSNRSFSSSIVAAMYAGIGLKSAILLRLTGKGATIAALLGAYSYVKLASEAADRLKMTNLIFYNALNEHETEMLYFIIEPVISNVEKVGRYLLSDNEIASEIIGLTR